MAASRSSALPAHLPACETATARALPFDCVALLLQGGGALGAYQAGVYEALAAHDISPNWVAGISIGAVNAGIIAGNAPEHRVQKLRDFWEGVTDAQDYGLTASWMKLWSGDDARRGFNQLAAWRAALTGVPGFYEPRVVSPTLLPSGAEGATSFYDTAKLRGTLLGLIDFDLLNRGEIRVSLGATNVRTGNFAYFDSVDPKLTLAPEHIMASGALPPGFAAVEIDGESYWDGGLVSNTPLDWVLEREPRVDTLAFQVDLWSARGRLPRTIAEVAARMKEIQYSSRTRASTDRLKREQKLKVALGTLLAKLPPALRQTEEYAMLDAVDDTSVHAIVQLIYRSPDYEADSKDYEFSRATMNDHWRSGFDDATRTLKHPEVLERPHDDSGVVVHDFTSLPHGA